MRGGRRPAVSPAARRAWRRRARGARAAAPASARTLSPQIRRRAPSTRPPSRVHAARPGKEVTPKNGAQAPASKTRRSSQTNRYPERRWLAASPEAVGRRPERRILGVVVFQRPRIELLSQTGAEIITGLSGFLKLTTKALTSPCQELDKVLFPCVPRKVGVPREPVNFLRASFKHWQYSHCVTRPPILFCIFFLLPITIARKAVISVL